jgi:hypothetical protein
MREKAECSVKEERRMMDSGGRGTSGKSESYQQRSRNNVGRGKQAVTGPRNGAKAQ